MWKGDFSCFGQYFGLSKKMMKSSVFYDFEATKVFITKKWSGFYGGKWFLGIKDQSCTSCQNLPVLSFLEVDDLHEIFDQ